MIIIGAKFMAKVGNHSIAAKDNLNVKDHPSWSQVSVLEMDPKIWDPTGLRSHLVRTTLHAATATMYENHVCHSIPTCKLFVRVVHHHCFKICHYCKRMGYITHHY